MNSIIYKTDKGVRKGCHPVCILTVYKGELKEIRICLVDEPGAWFEDKWNCHVDGRDFEANSRDEAIRRGIDYWGYTPARILIELETK